MRGPNISSYENRQTHICDNSSVHNSIDNNVNTHTDTEIVHIERKSQNECAVMVNAGVKVQICYVTGVEWVGCILIL